MKNKIKYQIGVLFFSVGGIFIISIILMFRAINTNSKDAAVINLAGRQRMLTQKMTKEAIGVAKGIIPPEELAKTADLFDKTLRGLMYGNKELPPCEDEKTLNQLKVVNGLWQTFYDNVKKLKINPHNTAALKYLADNNIELLKEMNKGVKLFEKYADANLRNIKIYALIIGFLTILTVIFILISSKKKIIEPIEKLTEATKQIAAGNLDINLEFNYKTEFDELGRAFEELAKSIKDYQNKLLKEKESIQEKVNKAVEKSEREKQYLSESVDRIVDIMEQVSQGDLTVQVEIRDDDNENIKRLFNNFNKLINRIRIIITDVTEAVQATASASAQISSSAEEMSAGAQQQSSQTSEVASAIEEMTKTILETAKNTNNAVEASKESSETAREGEKKILETKNGMQNILEVTNEIAEVISNLNKKADQIGEITQIIDEIAEQTNLLALNAAIEAARAGEHGRGFAVVADEVRKLAERTTKATKEIAETIQAIQVESKNANESMTTAEEVVKRGTQLADEIERVFKQIISSIENTVMEINQVAAASEEQSSTAEQISGSMEAINNVVNETSIGIQQIARASEDLQRLTENLNDLVADFKLNKNDMKSTDFAGSLMN